MKEIRFDSKNSLVSETELASVLQQLRPEVERMNEAAEKGYDDGRASINLPIDKGLARECTGLAKKKLAQRPEYLVVIGIGGSNLGSLAVQEAVLGRQYNECTKKIKVLFADTVDPDCMARIYALLASSMKKKKKVVVNAISKSGSTTESIANMEIIVGILRQRSKGYQKQVVITSDAGSRFSKFAEEKGFDVLKIPAKVGGRYSVFSPVGLFPLSVLGISPKSLLDGAALMRKRCLDKDLSKNPAAIAAATSYIQYKKGKNIHDLFVFSPDLESLGKWYRQLLAESIGKEMDLQGNKVFTGPTPTVSIGSTDLHSMGQLYLGGPFDKYTTFLRVDEGKSRISVPKMQEYSVLVDKIQGIALKDMMDAIYDGTTLAYKKGSRPYSEIILPDKSPSSIAQFMQFKMFETIYLASLLGVNPFDQPNVESYKIETRRILAERQIRGSK